MALVKDGEHAEDLFVLLEDDAELPDSEQAVIVSVDRWHSEHTELRARTGSLGIILQPDQSPDLVEADLDCFDVIVVNFPVFSDGRGFSHARRLREKMGYTGEIRAVGHIIRDQYLFLHRCGVNAIHVEDQKSADDWKAAMDEFSMFYQNTIDTRNPLMRMRQQ